MPEQIDIVLPQDPPKYIPEPDSEVNLQEWIEDLKTYRKYKYWLVALKWFVIT